MKIKGSDYKFTIRGVMMILLFAGLLAFGGGVACSAVYQSIANAPLQDNGEEKDGEAVPASSRLTDGAVNTDLPADGGLSSGAVNTSADPDMGQAGQNNNRKTKIVDSSQDVDVLVLVNKKNAISSDYVPHTLMQVDSYVPGKDEAYSYGRPELVYAFERLLADSQKEGLKIVASNAYRSYAVQKSTFESNVKKKGSVEAANKTSAKPGESEHQTGLAMDLTTKELGYGVATQFESTAEGKWIRDNCYKYGFIIRFPLGKEDITGYSYEPWHIRYVGEKAAKVIYENGWTLEEYLENTTR